MADPNLIKVCLTNKGEDTETPWAADLGPAGSDGSRKVKLVNVPFMHAKPTWGDTIIVRPVRNDGPPTWDREGVPWKQIATKIVEDGGRWAMIIDYAPTTSADEAFAALGKACDDAKIVCEGAWGPRDSDPGRVYLAVQKELNAEQVMGILVGASLPMDLIQIHPEPKKKQRAQTVVGISDDAGRPPSKPARAKTEPPVAAKSGASKSESSGAMKATKSETSAAMKSAAIKKSEASGATKAPAKPIANAVPAAKSDVTAKSAPAKPAAKAAPAKAAPAKAAPAKPAAKAAPAKAAPAKAPAKSAPAKAAAPTKAPAKPAKAEPAKSPPKAAPAKPASKAAPAKPAAKAAPAKPAKKK